jgi:hypothetical protein
VRRGAHRGSASVRVSPEVALHQRSRALARRLRSPSAPLPSGRSPDLGGARPAQAARAARAGRPRRTPPPLTCLRSVDQRKLQTCLSRCRSGFREFRHELGRRHATEARVGSRVVVVPAPSLDDRPCLGAAGARTAGPGAPQPSNRSSATTTLQRRYRSLRRQPLGYVPPAEFETAYCAKQSDPAVVVGFN